MTPRISRAQAARLSTKEQKVFDAIVAMQKLGLPTTKTEIWTRVQIHSKELPAIFRRLKAEKLIKEHRLRYCGSYFIATGHPTAAQRAMPEPDKNGVRSCPTMYLSGYGLNKFAKPTSNKGKFE